MDSRAELPGWLSSPLDAELWDDAADADRWQLERLTPRLRPILTYGSLIVIALLVVLLLFDPFAVRLSSSHDPSGSETWTARAQAPDPPMFEVPPAPPVRCRRRIPPNGQSRSPVAAWQRSHSYSGPSPAQRSRRNPTADPEAQHV